MYSEKESNISSPRILLTVRQFSEKHRAFSPGGLRFLIFNAGSNGLKKSQALLRLGRRVLIDEERFFNWIEQNQKEQ